MVENVDRLSAVQRAEANDLLAAVKDCDISVINVGSRLSEGEKAAMLLVSFFFVFFSHKIPQNVSRVG